MARAVDEEAAASAAATTTGSKNGKSGAGRFMVASAVGTALIEGLGAVDAKLVRPELRASMEAMVGKIAAGDAEKGPVVADGLRTFRTQFERLKKGMHLLVPHFGEVGPTDKEGERGEDELIRLELAAASGRRLGAAEWRRQREIEEQLEVAADVADATERDRRQRDRELNIAGGDTAAAAAAAAVARSGNRGASRPPSLRSLFVAKDEDDSDAPGGGGDATALFKFDAVPRGGAAAARAEASARAAAERRRARG